MGGAIPRGAPTPDNSSLQRVLSDQNAALRAQVHSLRGRVSYLEAENAQLRSIVVAVMPPQHFQQAYTDRSGNAVYLPTVIERLAIMQDHFRRQGTLKHWSASYPHLEIA